MATTNINTYGHRLSLHDALPLCCAAQVASLDAALGRITAPVILVAHSGGVITVAHWARNHARAIHGALLAAPPDFDSPLPAGYPSQDLLRRGGWLPVPRMRLPFPHIVAASDDDPLARKAREIGRANV